MILNKDQIKQLYQRTARFYDIALLGYRLLGVTKYRRDTIKGLQLKAGDTVVDLGCGTGANFALLSEVVGPTGRIIGVDLSPAMLSKAERKADQLKGMNIDLIEADIGSWPIPAETNGILATFAMEVVPEYDAVIQRIAGALRPGQRLALLGLKHPEKWPDWIIEVGIWLNKPFGVSRDYESFQPWKSVQQHMKVLKFKEIYFGAAYLCIGEN
jgi:demethylmenaquinone methyltransferase/2-methoxy-6-polyprenyl-1,4-benzoquinol methylase